MAIMFSKFKSLKKIERLLSKRDPSEQKTPSFNLRQEKEEAYEAVERGILQIPLNKIVGSVGRYHDFDNQFKTNKRKRDERHDSIKKALISGKKLPPIALYQIKEDFFILDGHHRFTAARDLGHSHISSRIVELLPTKDTLENKLYIEKTTFRDRAGLTEPIDLTEPDQTCHLQWQVDEHLKWLQNRSKKNLNFKQAAADWYRTIYLPLRTLVDKSGLVRSFPGRTVDDLYLYISVHQWERGKERQYGLGIDKLIPTDMEAFREKMAKQTEQEYPEMKREITVFILLNIEGKYEQSIFDKLIALDEVREVHSVHGSIDMIAKVTLMRDLLSSDAELLSQFTLTTIRQWKGVISTQTLIPGISKVKDTDRCHI